MKVTEFSKGQIDVAVQERIRNVDVVLDVGCGIRPVNFFLPVTHICVEPYAPYLSDIPQDRRYIVMNSTWDDVLPKLADKSVDTVFLLDVIEHIEKEQGVELLRHAERISRRQVVVFTPLGFFPQSYEEGSTDRWGYEGGHWQTHRSGWLPGDFGPGWEVMVCPDYHQVDQNEKPLEEAFGALWAFWEPQEQTRESDSERAMRRMLPWLRLWLDEVLPDWFYRLLVRINAKLRFFG